MNTALHKYLAPLRDGPVAVESPEQLDERRERALRSLRVYVEQYAEQGRRKRTRKRALWAFAAAAAVAGVSFSVGMLSSASTSVPAVTLEGQLYRVGESGAVSAQDIWSAVGRVQSADSPARLTTNDGLDLTLAPHTTASFAKLGTRENQAVQLYKGHLTCQVPKQRPGSRFAVKTPDALVTVRGTRFSVQVVPEADGTSRTCVRVTEGSVHVASGKLGQLLEPGQSWGCEPKAPEDEVVVVQPSADPESTETQSPRIAARKAPVRSTLQQETQILQAAVAAERAGRADEARQQLNRLLGQYPGSPLAPEARTLLKRLETPKE